MKLEIKKYPVISSGDCLFCCRAKAQLTTGSQEFSELGLGICDNLEGANQRAVSEALERITLKSVAGNMVTLLSQQGSEDQLCSKVRDAVLRHPGYRIASACHTDRDSAARLAGLEHAERSHNMRWVNALEKGTDLTSYDISGVGNFCSARQIEQFSASKMKFLVSFCKEDFSMNAIVLLARIEETRQVYISSSASGTISESLSKCFLDISKMLLIEDHFPDRVESLGFRKPATGGIINLFRGAREAQWSDFQTTDSRTEFETDEDVDLVEVRSPWLERLGRHMFVSAVLEPATVNRAVGVFS